VKHGEGGHFSLKGKCLYAEKAPRKFSWQFKEEVAKRMLNGESPTQLNRELGIVLSKLYKWRDQYRRGGAGVWPRAEGRPDCALPASVTPVKAASEARAENRVMELERKIGKQQLVIDFLQQALRRVEGGRAQTKSSGEAGSIPTSER
jgi:transposase